MNAAEVARLCRAVKAFCPSQAMDAATPEAWELVLGELSFTDARDAVVRLAALPTEPGRSRYIEPGHIISEIRKIQRDRLAATEVPPPPPGLTPTAGILWQRRVRAEIAAGTYQPPIDAPQLANPARKSWRDYLPETPTPTSTNTADADGPTEAELETERARQLAQLRAAMATIDPTTEGTKP